MSIIKKAYEILETVPEDELVTTQLSQDYPEKLDWLAFHAYLNFYSLNPAELQSRLKELGFQYDLRKVNDEPTPAYPQNSPKKRVLAYLGDALAKELLLSDAPRHDGLGDVAL